MQKSSQLIGESLDKVMTPALVVDMEVFERNMETMMDHISGTSCSVRPHAKTHKTPMIGHLQMRAGAIGLCCATIYELEAMAEGGLDHLFLASEVVSEDKIRKLVSLARYLDIIVSCDDPENLDVLSAAASAAGVTLGVVVNVDVGMGRSGVRDIDRAVDLAKKTHAARGVAFRGVFGYEGHVQFILDRGEREKAGRAANAHLVEAAEAVRNVGIPVEIVTGGGTGTFDIASESLTEIEAGSYIFMDNTYDKVGLPFNHSLTVLATVISRPDDDTVVLDVGMKGISVERTVPTVQGFEGIEIKRLSEAHANGVVTDGSVDPRPGQRLHLVPSHCCTTVNLYNEMITVRDGLVESVWPITGRGA